MYTVNNVLGWMEGWKILWQDKDYENDGRKEELMDGGDGDK